MGDLSTGFGLVLVRHPSTGKFAAVIETEERGLWISGGHVEVGETFEAAAMREAKEELGIEVKLTGVIRVEHTPSSITDKKTGKTYGRSRYRVIFTGEPVDPSRPLKDKPDEESDGALWLSRLELEERAAKGELRSKDFLRFVQYVDDGQPIFPLAVFSREADPLHDHLAASKASGTA